MKYLLALSFMILVLLLSGCSGSSAGGTTTGNPLAEDFSTSGAVAGAVGGALSGSGSNSNLARLIRNDAATYVMNLLLPQAIADNSCPTYKTPSGSGCTAMNGTLWLDYASCEFAGAAVTWSGVQALIMSTGTGAQCTTFPYPGAGNSLYRQYVSSSGSTTPSGVILRDSFGTIAIIDDSTADLGNFDSVHIPTVINGGYGDEVTFDPSTGARKSITVDQRIKIVGFMDHSINGSNISITETPGASTRTASGTVTVYLNLLEVIGTSTFTNITHSDTCCQPIAGTITTAFTAGSVGPVGVGNQMLGHSESLTFTGCGTATYTGVDGNSTPVALAHCF